MTAALMPAAFIGHGSPMNTLESNRYTSAWQALGRSLPRPRAVLAISAHWYINGSAVTAMRQPRVIHDFYGFPRELFEFDYPAPGSPEVAAGDRRRAAAELSSASTRTAGGWTTARGRCWRTSFRRRTCRWCSCRSTPARRSAITSSWANDWQPCASAASSSSAAATSCTTCDASTGAGREGAFDWGVRFDAEVKRIMTSAPKEILAISGRTPDYALAVPTPEHFLPLPYLAGLCEQAGEAAEVLIEGGALGSITMTSYLLGCHGLPHPLAAWARSRAARPHHRAAREHQHLTAP